MCSCSSVVPEGLSLSPTSITSSYSHWNWMCTLSWIHRGKSHTKFDRFYGSSHVLLWMQNEDNDFLYRDFWLSHSQNDSVLSEAKGGGFFVAFSRDQPQKVYVQHKMQEQSHRVWNLLSEGAAIYVAGSSTKMPSDVLLSFEEIISKESGLPQESAVRWLRALEKAGKYNVENILQTESPRG